MRHLKKGVVMSNKKLYVFTGNGEVIVGNDREKIIEEYFHGTRRNFEEYDEEVSNDGTALIKPHVSVKTY